MSADWAEAKAAAETQARTEVEVCIAALEAEIACLTGQSPEDDDS